MGFASSLLGYRGLAALTIAAVGTAAAVTMIESTQHATRVCAIVDGQEMDGLAEVSAMSFVDDRVYLLSQRDNCLTVLSQSESGSLALVEHIAREASNPVPDGARKLPVAKVFSISSGECMRRTRDGRYLFVGGPASLFLFEHGEDKSLNLVTFHGMPGTYNPVLDRTPRPAYLRFALSPDEKFLVTHCLEVVRFDREAKGFERVQLVEGVPPCRAFCMSPDGRHVYGGYSERLLRAFTIDPDTRHLSQVQELTSEECGVYKKKRATSLEASPDGSFVAATFVGDKGDVVVLRRNQETGKLSVAQVLNVQKSNIADLNYPTCATFSPDTQTLYVGCSGSKGIVVLRKDPMSDSFSYLETIKDPSMHDPTCLAINGRFLYVCSREPGTLTVFRINEENDQTKETAEGHQKGDK